MKEARVIPRKAVRTAATLLVGALAVTGLGACASTPRAAAAECPDPGVVLGVEPYEKPATLETAYVPLGKALSRELGCPVEIRVLDNHAAVVDALGNGEIQLAHLTPTGYAVAAQETEMTPAVTFGMPNGNMGTYTAAIWVPADSAVTRPAELAGHSLALGAQGTTSGDTLPRRALADANVADQVEISYTGGHDAALAALVSGAADAAEIDSRTLVKALADGRFDAGAHRQIWESGAVPNGPIVVAPDLAEKFTADVEEALLGLEPRAVRKVGALLGIAPGGRMVGVDDIAYTELLTMVDVLGLGSQDVGGPRG